MTITNTPVTHRPSGLHGTVASVYGHWARLDLDTSALRPVVALADLEADVHPGCDPASDHTMCANTSPAPSTPSEP